MGGVLRAVLPVDDKFYEDYERALEGELASEHLLNEVCRFRPGKAILQDKGDKICHKVIHYLVDDEFCLADIGFCSPAVYEQYVSLLESKTPVKLFFGKWQDGSGYEEAVLKALTYCSTILMGKVASGGAFSELKLSWNVIPLVKDKLSAEAIDLELSTTPQGEHCVLLIPESRSFPVFDGFLWSRKRREQNRLCMSAGCVLERMKRENGCG